MMQLQATVDDASRATRQKHDSLRKVVPRTQNPYAVVAMCSMNISCHINHNPRHTSFFSNKKGWYCPAPGICDVHQKTFAEKLFPILT